MLSLDRDDRAAHVAQRRLAKQPGVLTCRVCCRLSIQRRDLLAEMGFRMLAPEPYVHLSMSTALHLLVSYAERIPT